MTLHPSRARAHAGTKGSIVVDELIIPIVDIYLDERLIHFVGRLSGPVPARETDSYVICDRSGAVVFRTTPGIPGLRWGEVEAGASLYVYAPVGLDGHIATPAGRP